MIKRLASLFLAAIMAVSLLSGCGAKNNTDNGKKAESKAGNTNFNKDGYPIVKDKVTFKMYSEKDVRHSDFNQMEFFKKLEEKTNIHIEWEYEDMGAGGQKKNLILASGQYPDAFFSGIKEDDIAKYASQGVFVKLDSLIEQYGPNVKAAFKQKPLYKNLCTYFDGSVYSFCTANESEIQYNCDVLFMYKPWLDKLNLKVPTTMDEFYTTLKAFKEKDPNGNGKADEIPFTCTTAATQQSFMSLFAAFGRTDLVMNSKAPQPVDHFVLENGKVVFTADKKEWKDAIIYMNKMFKEGLFDQEIFTQDAKLYFAKGKTPDVTVGSFILWTAGNLAGPERAKDYIPVAPMKGPSGKQIWTKYNAGNGQLSGASRFAITKDCKEPEILMRWVNECFDKKTSAQATYGPIGKVLKEGPDGLLQFNPTPQGMSLDEFRRKDAPTFIGPFAVFTEDIGKVIEQSAAEKEKLEIKRNVYNPYLKSETLPGILFTEEETQWNASVGSDIQNYVNDRRAKWMLDGGIEKEWDEYLAKLKQLKLDEHVKKIQTAYDRFVK